MSGNVPGIEFADALADLLVWKAGVDKTAPDANELKFGWQTDSLFQAIDGIVVGYRGEPEAYAYIGRRVLLKVIDKSPEVAVLARLAIFRGERLLPLNPAREENLLTVASELDREVAALPLGTRKLRCASLLNYNKGVFFSACGRFDLAAQLCGQSVREAEQLGDKVGVAIGKFCEQSNVLKHMLMDDCSGKELADQFSALEQAFHQVSDDLAGSPLQVQWAQGNCPFHMAVACIWLCQWHSDMNVWMQKALDAAPALGKAFKPGAELLEALLANQHSEPQAEEKLRKVANGSGDPEIRATALLVLVRRALDKCNRTAAMGWLQIMPEQGAQHIRMIAQRSVDAE